MPREAAGLHQPVLLEQLAHGRALDAGQPGRGGEEGGARHLRLDRPEPGEQGGHRVAVRPADGGELPHQRAPGQLVGAQPRHGPTLASPGRRRSGGDAPRAAEAPRQGRRAFRSSPRSAPVGYQRPPWRGPCLPEEGPKPFPGRQPTAPGGWYAATGLLLRAGHKGLRKRTGSASGSAPSPEESSHDPCVRTVLAPSPPSLAPLRGREERGATAVEYGLLVGLIAVVIIVAVTALGTGSHPLHHVVTPSAAQPLRPAVPPPWPSAARPPAGCAGPVSAPTRSTTTKNGNDMLDEATATSVALRRSSSHWSSRCWCSCVMGIAEFGRAYYIQTTLSGAAREGVRVMALQNDAGGGPGRRQGRVAPARPDRRPDRRQPRQLPRADGTPERHGHHHLPLRPHDQRPLRGHDDLHRKGGHAMRRMSTPVATADERGAVDVVVALLIIPLWASPPSTVDVAALWWQTQQLQTGADAGALAIAQDCGAGACGVPATDRAEAREPANNAGSRPPRRTVSLPSTGPGDGAHRGTRQHGFARSSASARPGAAPRRAPRWGAPSGGHRRAAARLLLVRVEQQTGGGLPSGSTARTRSTSRRPPDRHPDCTGPSNNVVPGGFGWLAADAAGAPRPPASATS